MEHDFEVQFVDSGGGTGSESVTWDQAAKTITIGVVPHTTTANEVVDLFANTAGPRDRFDLFLDKTQDGTNDGTGAVNIATESTADGAAAGTDFVITRRDGVETRYRYCRARDDRRSTSGRSIRIRETATDS